jgi:hypothetical protein
MVEFIFTCPRTHKTFTSADCDITDNHGIKTDAEGNKTLDARVALKNPCPFCGSRHSYHASELACPFN